MNRRGARHFPAQPSKIALHQRSKSAGETEIGTPMVGFPPVPTKLRLPHAIQLA